MLDCDEDGLLSAEELFAFAIAVGHTAQIPLPPDVDSPASPAWLVVYWDLTVAHAGHRDGIDRAAFGRLVSLGAKETAGGMALSNHAIMDTTELPLF